MIKVVSVSVSLATITICTVLGSDRRSEFNVPQK